MFRSLFLGFVLIQQLCVDLASATDNFTDFSAGCFIATSSYAPLRIIATPYTPARLRSPNYGFGRSYPPNTLCRWSIAAPDGFIIFINITSLDIDTTVTPANARARSKQQQQQSGVFVPNFQSDIIQIQSSHFPRGRSAMLSPAVDLAVVGADTAISGCEGDFLDVLDGNDYRQRHQLIGRYCSDTAPRPIVSVYNEVQVIFQSDGFKEDAGFELEFTAVDPSDVGIATDGRLFIKSRERFMRGNDNDLISSGRMELLDFPGPMPGKTSGGKMKAVARSGNRHSRFYERNSCAKGATILTDTKGRFTSPNFGRGQYAPGSHCEWLITAPRDRVVLLQFEDLRLEYGLETRGCTFDYVEIFDGRDPTAPVLGRFCGRALPNVPIRSTSNYLYVVFQTDLSREDFGFSAKYQIVSASPGCDGTTMELTEKHGEIISPNFGYGNYPSNSECRWTIKIPESYYISLQFIDFDVESHGQQPSFGNGLNVPSDLLNTHGHRRCSYDYLEIFDGTNPDDGRSFGRYCGSATLQNTPATIRSTQNTLTLVFRTDFSGERRGFRLQYSAVLPFPGCNGKVKFINEMSGELTSPNFGQDSYPPNTNCVWIVDPQLGMPSTITISFMHFQVEGRYASVNGQVTCPYDFVEIGVANPNGGYDVIPTDDEYDTLEGQRFAEMMPAGFSMTNMAGNGRRRFCGQSLPSPITLRGRRLRIRFHSDMNKQSSGFLLRYKFHDPVPFQDTEMNFLNQFRGKDLINRGKIIPEGYLDHLKPTTFIRTTRGKTTTEEPTTVPTTMPPTATTTTPEPATTTPLLAIVEDIVETRPNNEDDDDVPYNLKSEMELGNDLEGDFALVVDEDLTEAVKDDKREEPYLVDDEQYYEEEYEEEYGLEENDEEGSNSTEPSAQEPTRKETITVELPSTTMELATEKETAVEETTTEAETTVSTTVEPSTTTEAHEIEGVVIDESFSSGDMESTNNDYDMGLQLKAVLFDPVPAETQQSVGELVPLDLSDELQPGVNVTLLSIFENMANEPKPMGNEDNSDGVELEADESLILSHQFNDLDNNVHREHISEPNEAWKL